MLANGAPNVLSVALAAGYGSHEAFTRAFRAEFGKTPERVRQERDLTSLQLVEPIRLRVDGIDALVRKDGRVPARAAA